MIFRKLLFYCLGLSTLIFFSKCSSNIEGTYVANHGIGYDTLQIYPDNKFVRIYYDPNYTLNSRCFSDSGTWEYEGGGICFNDWIDRSGTEHIGGSEKIIFITDVRKSFLNNEVKIIINYDLDYYYLKQK